MASEGNLSLTAEEEVLSWVNKRVLSGDMTSPVGPIRSMVPEIYHRYISMEVLSSYVVSEHSSSEILMEKLGQGTSVIVQGFSDKVYPHIMNNLTLTGEKAVLDIHPWIVNVLTDWCSFDSIICINPLMSNNDSGQPLVTSKSEPGSMPETVQSKLKSVSVDEEPASSSQTPLSAEYDTGFEWNCQSTKLLLEKYREHRDKFNKPVKKASVWRIIASEMREFGHKVLFSDAERKFRNLKSHFKKTIAHNSKSGNSRSKWEYFDQMFDLLKNDDAIFPQALKSTMVSDSQKPCSELKENASEQTIQQTIVFKSDPLTPPKPLEKTGKRKSNPPMWFQEHMEQQKKEKEARLAAFKKMHDENIAIQRKKLEELHSMNAAFMQYLTNHK